MGFSHVERYDAGEGGRFLENYIAGPYGSSFGAAPTMIQEVLSLFGSVEIITVILRSSAGLKTSYHRLMSGMSLFDICASVAMGRRLLYLNYRLVSVFRELLIIQSLEKPTR